MRAMRCIACGGEMILMNAVPDDTMEVPSFEHHTFTCSECQDTERRLVFTKHSHEGDTEPTPVQAAPPIAPASTVQDDTDATPVQAAPPIALLQQRRMSTLLLQCSRNIV